MNRFYSRLLASFFCLTLAAGLSLGASRASSAQQEPENIEQAMSPDEFRRAGLQKLSPEELAKLNAWLKGYREKVAQKVSAREARTRMQILVSRVDGVFNGATQGTIIPLEDGTSWRLANAGEHYGGHADHPGVAVFKSIFGWKMRIGGVAEFYVMPVKTH